MRAKPKVLYSTPKKHTNAKRHLSTLLLLVIFAVYAVSFTHFFGHACPINLLFGVPCPGCGLTRACLLLLRGDFVGAFRMHPLVYVLPIPAVFVVLGYFSPKFAFSRTSAVTLSLCIALFVGVYLYRMIAFFPSEEPIAYNENSLLFLLKKLLSRFFS